MTALDVLVIFPDAEGVHEELAVEEAHATATQGGVFLVIDDVLVDHGALRVVEGPGIAKGKGGVIPSRQALADDLVEGLLARVVDLAHGSRQRLLDGRGGHEGVERGLVRVGFEYRRDVVHEHRLVLRREVEDHIDVQRFEHICIRDIDDSVQNLLGAAIFFISVHLSKQSIVETLDANGQSLHYTVEFLDMFGKEMIWVRLARHIDD